jgi:hypothetical protein
MTIFVLAVAIKTRFYFPNKRKDYEKENIFNQNKEIKEQSYVMTIKINTIIKKFFWYQSVQHPQLTFQL